jgi:hypothetical protein
MFWEQLVTLCMSIGTAGNSENGGLFNNTFSSNSAGAGLSRLSIMNMETAGCSETLVPLVTNLDGISSHLLRPESN